LAFGSTGIAIITLLPVRRKKSRTSGAASDAMAGCARAICPKRNTRGPSVRRINAMARLT